MATRAKIVIVLGIALFSISWAAILVLLAGAPAAVCALWRLVFSTLIMAAACLAAGERPRFTLLNLVGGVALGLHFVSWMKSLFLVPVAVSTTIVVMYPLFAALADALVMGERPSEMQVVGLVLAFLGVVILYFGPRMQGVFIDPLGVLYAFIGALAASLYFLAGRSLRRMGVSTLGYATPVYGVASLSVLVYVILMGIDPLHYGARTWVFLLLLALVPMIGGHTMMNYALRFVKASTATSIALGEPVGASLLAYLVLGEPLNPWYAPAMAMSITGILMVIWWEKQRL